MKEDEKRFFRIVYECCRPGRFYRMIPRDVINILYSFGSMHYKRAWYLLKKWCVLGFYDYGVTLDLGWIETDKLPERYKILLEEKK